MPISVALIPWWMTVVIMVIFKDALFEIISDCREHMATQNNIFYIGLVDDMFPSPMLSAMTWAF